MVKKSLYLKKLKIKLLNFYNNKYHRLIGMSHNEAYKITKKDEKKLMK